MNLSAIRDPDGFMQKHVADSLCAAELLTRLFAGGERIRLLDVGTGGGFPALPLAIALDGRLELCCLDATRKKLAFVRQALLELGLEGECVCGRAEELARGGLREAFGAVTARAVAVLPELCELCLPFVRAGGVFLAMKQLPQYGEPDELDEAADAIRALGGAVERVEYYDISDSLPKRVEKSEAQTCSVPRRIIVIRKAAPTPGRYPRKYAQIKGGTGGRRIVGRPVERG